MQMQTHPSSLDCTSLVEPRKVVVSIFAVIVLYKMAPTDSSSFRSLSEAISRVDDSSLRVSLLIADNTPGGQPVPRLPPGVRYEAFHDNPGLVIPYRRAISAAELEGFDWLLTLDQDTHLPPDFLTTICGYAREYGTSQQVAAIVPRIYDNGRAVSPLRFAGGFLPLVIKKSAGGLLKPHSSALNSASVLRVSALNRTGGYDDEFPLNNSDTALFLRLDRAGYRIVLAGEVLVQHELAIMSRGERMTVQRYRQLLNDERNFWDLHMSTLARGERLVRLIGRWVKDYLRKEDPAFLRETLLEIKGRLFSSRRSRLRKLAQPVG